MGHRSGASCSTAKDANTSPAAAVSVANEARNVFTPAVSSHAFDHDTRSRPDASSRSRRKSASDVFPYSWRLKYAATPDRNAPSPTHATSWRSTDAPLA